MKPKIQKKRIILLACFLIAIAGIIGGIYADFSRQSDEYYTAKNGVLNLSGWNGRNILALSGQWDFYFDKVLTKQDFDENPEPDLKATVPSIWNDYVLNGKSMPGFGYATYRLHVIGAKPGQPLAIKMSPVSTAYELYIDDSLMTKNGSFGTSEQTHKPFYKIETFSFTPQSESFDIIVHVSNFTYARGGMWFTSQLGSPDAIQNAAATVEHRDWFLLGCLFIMILYASCVLMLRRKERALGYFIFLGANVIIRIIIIGSYIIYNIPYISNFDISVRLEYLTLYWLPTSFLMLSSVQFQEYIKRVVVRVSLVYAAIFSLVILITPISVFTQTKIFSEVGIVLLVFYTLYKISKAFLLGNRDAGPILIGACFMAMGATYDLLLQNCMIPGSSAELMPVGFFVFLLFEAFVIARDYTSALHEKELALVEIIEMDKKERTAELKFLKSQIKPHFLYNALSAIANVCGKDATQAENLIIELALYLRGSMDFSGDEGISTLGKELDMVQYYFDVERARFGEKIKLERSVSVPLETQLPTLVIQPLVENAVRHGISKKRAGGTVYVTVEALSEAVHVVIEDDGVGMEQKKADALLQGDLDGKHVGLLNIHHRLKRLYGAGLSIQSSPDIGTKISFTIPMEVDKNA